MKLEFSAEICCDECGNVTHNHFDCPACKRKYAATDVYGECVHLAVLDEGIENFTLMCEYCGAKFKVRQTAEFFEDWIWELQEK